MSDITTTAATTAALTLADAKRHLNVSSTADDTYIGDLVTAATDMLEARCNRCFVTQTRKLTMDSFNDSRYVHTDTRRSQARTIFPRRSPVKSVSSITYVATSGTTTTISSSDYVVSTGDSPARITEGLGATWPVTYGDANDVVVTYVAGHSTVSTGVPGRVKQAIRMLVGHWYRNREAVLQGTISKEIELSLDALLESEQVEQYG